MIRFALACVRDHRFDSWFQSGDAFDRLLAVSQVTCPVCGTTDVAKSLMAPNVSTAEVRAVQNPGLHGRATDDATQVPPGPAQGAPLRAPQTDVEKALAQLRREVEANSEYVGLNFAKEARAMHEGDAPARAIYGEARAHEARSLIDDGVPVAPLPFIPARRTN